MTYNIHPIFVHFPIALLMVYSVVKALPLSRWMPAVSWKHIERALLLVGVLGAFAALATGEAAEHLVRPNHALVEAHSAFAASATWIYGALLAGEIASVLFTRFPHKVLGFLKSWLAEGWLSKALAIVALAALSVTGLLGGVMVYGTSADPVAPFILRLLGISL